MNPTIESLIRSQVGPQASQKAWALIDIPTMEQTDKVIFSHVWHQVGHPIHYVIRGQTKHLIESHSEDFNLAVRMK